MVMDEDLMGAKITQGTRRNMVNGWWTGNDDLTCMV
jgi:hypothetical protein